MVLLRWCPYTKETCFLDLGIHFYLGESAKWVKKTELQMWPKKTENTDV